MGEGYLWIFTAGGPFPASVFTTRGNAERWIVDNGVTGCLTRYPIDEALYDWAVRMDFFKPKRDDQRTPEFKANFSCASAEHYHYENGELQS